MHVYKSDVPHELLLNNFLPFFTFTSPSFLYLPFSSAKIMLLVTALVSFVVLAARVAANPSNHHPHSHSLSIAKHIDPNAKYNLVQRDRRRFTHLMSKANPVNSSSLVVEDSETAELPLINTGLCYVANVGIGEPPTLCKSRVDFFCWDIVFYMSHFRQSYH